MKPNRRELGFWRTVLRTSAGQLIGIEGLLAVVLGLPMAALMVTNTSTQARVVVAGDVLSLGGALVGVVFAGFALVIALMSDRYLLLLDRSPNGVRAFMAPFMVNIGTLVFVLLLAVVYRAGSGYVPGLWEKGAFFVLCVVFLYAALNIVALARSVMAHGTTRAEQATIDELQRQVAAQKARGGASRESNP